MREPLESEYFNWLCAKVLSIEVSAYFDLMRVLHQTEFVWIVLGDRNRAEDGVELRTYFLRETDWDRDPDWLSEPCSVLEMLIAFADRACFQTDMPLKDWFWIFLTNLGLDDYRQISRSDIRVIDKILGTFMDRTYHSNGEGGLFPVRYPKHDQTQVEIWYQFCEYLEDQGLI